MAWIIFIAEGWWLEAGCVLDCNGSSSAMFSLTTAANQLMFYPSFAVASLVLMSPGPATDRVLKKTDDHFSHHHLLFSWNTDDLFCSSLSLLLISLGCHPLKGVSPQLCLPVRPHLSTVLCVFSHKIFFLRVSPPGECHPGRSTPPAPQWRHWSSVCLSGCMSVCLFVSFSDKQTDMNFASNLT